MNTRGFWWFMQIGILALELSVSAPAESPSPAQNSLRGTIDDFTRANSNPAGPWEVAGEWSLKLKGDSRKADFNANLTMVRSDYWVLIQSSPGTTVNDPSTRSPHMHHVTLTDGDVAQITNGIEITGTATLTASGGVPPFGSSVPITIDIISGSIDTYSNIKISFGGMTATHFGPQPIEGVARN